MKSIAIRNLYPQVTTVGGEKYCWDAEGNEVEIDEVKVQKELEKLQAEYDAKQYQRDRATIYPSIQEQLDMQYWDAVNGTTKWKDAIAKVKTDNPKPSE